MMFLLCVAVVRREVREHDKGAERLKVKECRTPGGEKAGFSSPSRRPLSP